MDVEVRRDVGNAREGETHVGRRRVVGVGRVVVVVVVFVLFVVGGSSSSVARRTLSVRVQAVPVRSVSLLHHHQGQLGHSHAIRQTLEQLQRRQLDAVVPLRFDTFRSSITLIKTETSGRERGEGRGDIYSRRRPFSLARRRIFVIEMRFVLLFSFLVFSSFSLLFCLSLSLSRSISIVDLLVSMLNESLSVLPLHPRLRLRLRCRQSE